MMQNCIRTISNACETKKGGVPPSVLSPAGTQPSNASIAYHKPSNT